MANFIPHISPFMMWGLAGVLQLNLCPRGGTFCGFGDPQFKVPPISPWWGQWSFTMTPTLGHRLIPSFYDTAKGGKRKLDL